MEAFFSLKVDYVIYSFWLVITLRTLPWYSQSCGYIRRSTLYWEADQSQWWKNLNLTYSQYLLCSAIWATYAKNAEIISGGHQLFLRVMGTLFLKFRLHLLKITPLLNCKSVVLAANCLYGKGTKVYQVHRYIILSYQGLWFRESWMYLEPWCNVQLRSQLFVASKLVNRYMLCV